MGSASGGNANSYWYTYIEWSSYNYDAYRAAVTVTLYMWFRKSISGGINMSHNTTSYVQADGQVAGLSVSWNHAVPYNGNYYCRIGSYTFLVDRGHGRWINVYGVLGRTAGSDSYKGSSTAGGSEYLQPKSNWAVTYNANGGTGSIGSQTKWYNESIVLSDGAALSRLHYTLVGWNTQADGSGTHYDLGATYTGNAGLTLYAEWKLNCVQTCTKVGGEIKKGILYTKVNGDIKIPYAGYVKVNGHWKQIKET